MVSQLDIQRNNTFNRILKEMNNIPKLYNRYVRNGILNEKLTYSFYQVIIDLCKIEDFNREIRGVMSYSFKGHYNQLYVWMLANQSFSKVENYITVKHLMNSIARLSINDKNQLIIVLRNMSPELFVKLLTVIQQFISVSCILGKSISNSLLVLDLFHFVNDEKRIVKRGAFHNVAINQKLNYVQELSRWENENNETLSLRKFSYVLDEATKKNMLYYGSDRERNRNRFNDVINYRRNYDLKIKVSRENLIHDTIEQLQNKDPSQLKKELKVKFINEEAVDEGGVKREFFQLIVKDLFNPNYGMFEYDKDTNYHWFNSLTFVSNMDYELVGKILGIAIYNKVILDLHFPRIIYKKLLNKKIDFRDLKETFPEIGNSLERLLEYDGDVENDFGLDFTIQEDFFGEIRTIELKEGGSEIMVNADNRREYVNLYVDYKLNKSIAGQFRFFKEGFYKLCDGVVLRELIPEELELIICGSQELNFEELKRTTKYAEGYNRETPIIQGFWEIVEGLCLEDKKKLLFFISGSDRVPVEGLSALNITITRNGADSDRLPTSQTCYNQLLLPEYSSKEKLEKLLIIAVNNSRGFGLI
jgi:ubiquitin-protein ligase E3 A